MDRDPAALVVRWWLVGGVLVLRGVCVSVGWIGCVVVRLGELDRWCCCFVGASESLAVVEDCERCLGWCDELFSPFDQREAAVGWTVEDGGRLEAELWPELIGREIGPAAEPES